MSVEQGTSVARGVEGQASETVTSVVNSDASAMPKGMGHQAPSTTASAEEIQAAKVALSGDRWGRLKVGARAARKFLKNPDDTRQVFVLGLVLNGPWFPSFLQRFASEGEGNVLLVEKPSIDSKSVNYDRLRALPNNTLGREYVRFLDDNHLDPDLFQAPPGLPEEPTFLAKRMRQVHDIWHVLTGYTPDIPGEIALQAFTYAQTGLPISQLITATGFLRQSVLRPAQSPKLGSEVVRAYRRGKAAVFLPSVRIEKYFEADLVDVRRELRIAHA